jgi:hypothetical protein
VLSQTKNAVYLRHYYQEHGESVRARQRTYHREYRKDHGDKVRSQDRAAKGRCSEKLSKSGATWRKNNKKKVADFWRKSKYGITPEQYDAMVLSQEGRCGICECPLTETGTHLDHSHVTGKVRGILCNRCNVGLGYYELGLSLKFEEWIRRNQ